jgi:hypothetical protein
MKIKLFNLFCVSILAAASLLPLYTPHAHAEPVNLIKNASVETTDAGGGPQDWLQGGWGNNTRGLSYPNAGHSGSHSVKVEITSYADGDAKWYFSPVNITGSTEYTYSDY